MKRTWIIIGVGVLLAALVAVSFIGGNRKPKGERAYLETVERQTIQRVVKARGEVDPRVKVDLSAHVIAKIETLHVREGDDVIAGRPVVDLEKEAFAANRKRAAADLEIQQSRLRLAEIEVKDQQLKLARVERLFADKIFSQGDLEAAQLAAQSAELRREQAVSGILQARATLDKAVDDLEKTTIYAPISGRVIQLNAEEGEVVVSGTMNNPASVIGTIADLSELLAVVNVDETEIVHVQLDQSAVLHVDANRDTTYHGKVVEIGNAGFERPGQRDVTFFEVKVLFNDPDEALKAGMSVRAEVQTAEVEDALVVPVQAVVQRSIDGSDDEQPVVLQVADGTVAEQPITTGISNITHVQVTNGLEEGVQVVTGPHRVQRDLKDGDPVREREQDDEDE